MDLACCYYYWSLINICTFIYFSCDLYQKRVEEKINQIFSLSMTGCKSLVSPSTLSLLVCCSIHTISTASITMTLKRRREKIVLGKRVVRQAAMASRLCSSSLVISERRRRVSFHCKKIGCFLFTFFNNLN